GSRVTGAIAIMLAFGSQKKTIEPAVLPHRGKAVETPGKYLVHVTLMTDVHNESVARRVENPVQRDGQFDHAEIWTKMPACLRKYSDQLIAHFLRQLRQILFAQRFDIGRRANPVEQAFGGRRSGALKIGRAHV